MAVTAAPPSSQPTALDRRFRFTERRTTLRTEALGGLSTFLTMSYILFVNPAILAAAEVPATGVAVATALAAAIATAAMGLFANLPFALAPGLGINAVVAFDIVLAQGHPWQVAMACIVIEGVIALVLVLAGLREAVVNAVPDSLKLAIGVGIGLFITLVGLRQGGIVVNDPATGIALGDLSAGPPLIALAGIFVAAALSCAACAARCSRGSPSRPSRASSSACSTGRARSPSGPAAAGSRRSATRSTRRTSATRSRVALIPTIFALFMTDFFDTIGTAMAVGTAGGLVDRAGRLPGLKRLLVVDSARPRWAARWARRR